MKIWLAFLLALCIVQANDTPEARTVATENVNSRYMVESVELPDSDWEQLPLALKDALRMMVGRNFDQEEVERLSQKLRRELRVTAVEPKVTKGDQPDHVKVLFEIRRPTLEPARDESRLTYHGHQGWSTAAYFDFDLGRATFGGGYENDADRLLERNQGFNVNFAVRLTDRIRARIDYDDFRQRWNGATLAALDASPETPGIYRWRRNVQPSLTVAITRNLTWTGAVSFQDFQTQFPVARTESANAVVNTLRLRRRWESSDTLQEVNAGYILRAATNLLNTGFGYTRHFADARYVFQRARHEFKASTLIGRLSGRAPLFDRFSLGNTQTLRGWNKFDVAPLGGDRVWHASAEYRYHVIRFFYDTGAVWEAKEKRAVRHGVGAGLSGDWWMIAVAFPIRENRVQPLFLVAANF